MAPFFSPNFPMKKTCDLDFFKQFTSNNNTDNSVATPGKSGDILFNHNIPEDIKHDFQQCRYND
jgi:hypothetical protein